MSVHELFFTSHKSEKDEWAQRVTYFSLIPVGKFRDPGYCSVGLFIIFICS